MNFFAKVYREVEKIPKGQVASYGQIAARLGHPRAARAVGLALRLLPENSALPWHRVLNGQGMISIENLAVPKAEQARRLQEEGVRVKLKDGNFWVDLEKYGWNPLTYMSLREAKRRSNLLAAPKRLLRLRSQ